MGKPPEKAKSTTLQLENVNLTPALTEEVERQIGPLVSQQAKGQVVSRVVAMMLSEKFSGPIAHPRHLREYEEILSGSAERIVTMAENEQNHNIDMESRIVQAEIDDRKRGMNYGLVAICLLIVLGFVSGFWGNNTLAGMLLFGGFAGVAGIFINGRLNKSDKEE